MNNKINNYVIKIMDDDAAIINTTIELADNERNFMNTPTIQHRAQLGKTFITETHKHNNSITCDGKHV